MPASGERIMTKACIAMVVFGRSEEGASLVEYATCLALIVFLCIVAMSVLGTQISNFMNSASNSI
jgi:Flp pilus assembly pilin Flp